MSLVEDFEAAQARVKGLLRPPGVDELLDLYSLFKQATAGDAGDDAPGMFDFKARAKYDAWQRRKGMSRDDAMRGYVALVSQLAAKYA